MDKKTTGNTGSNHHKTTSATIPMQNKQQNRKRPPDIKTDGELERDHFLPDEGVPATIKEDPEDDRQGSII